MKKNCFVVAGVCLALVCSAWTLTSCSPVPKPISDEITIDVNEGINVLLDRYTDSRLDAGSDMKLLVDGPVSRAAYRELIESATDHINLEMWDIDDDSERPENIGQEFVDLLIEKAQAGVLVNVILDPVAMKGYSDPALITQLREGGVNVRLFMPPLDKILIDQLLYRTHKKFVVVDGRGGILGGMNFGFDYMGENQWRDTNVQISGPAAASMQRMFLQDWAELGEPLVDQDRFFPPLESTGDYSVRIIDQRPCEDDFDLNEAIRIALRCAKDHVDIEAPYFNPMPWLEDEIVRAADRGVRVRILTNSEETNDMMTPIYYIAASYFQNMVDHGVKVYLWGWSGHTLHSKVMVVDNKFAFISSYNFNYRSIVWDSECAACFTDPEPVAAVQEMIDYDIGREFVTPITQAWLDSQDKAEQAAWEDARSFRYITKEPSPE
jgi:cardiolipin synthase